MHKLKPQTENKTANAADQQFSLGSRAPLNTLVNRLQCFHSGLYKRTTCLKLITLKAQKSTEPSLWRHAHTHLCTATLITCVRAFFLWTQTHGTLYTTGQTCQSPQIHLSRLKPQNPPVLVPTLVQTSGFE